MSAILNVFFAVMFGYLAWKVINDGVSHGLFGKIEKVENPIGFRFYAGLLIVVCLLNVFFLIKGR